MSSPPPPRFSLRRLLFVAAWLVSLTSIVLFCLHIISPRLFFPFLFVFLPFGFRR